jgi:1-deoxy-D-xylulose-5-phosphate synthase
VELTIALHRVFDTPRDRFVMDVSHQGYVHKMFTGRLDRFGTMRQFGGLNGFLLRTESEHDCYGAGHAGTALSAGLGMAVGRDLRGGDENSCRSRGDAAFTCGISYEALNNVKTHTKRSSSCSTTTNGRSQRNVGAIANYLNSIVTNPTYAHLHDKARDFVQAILGKTGVQLAHKVEESVKGLLVPSVISKNSVSATTADRWTRYPVIDPDIRVFENAGRAGSAAHSHQERQRVRTGH